MKVANSGSNPVLKWGWRSHAHLQAQITYVSERKTAALFKPAFEQAAEAGRAAGMTGSLGLVLVSGQKLHT